MTLAIASSLPAPRPFERKILELHQPMRRAFDAKLSCHACNLVNQSARRLAGVQTNGEITLQIVNKRLPGKTLRRNHQASENLCKGLDSEY
jgi:hypothetical protein